MRTKMRAALVVVPVLMSACWGGMDVLPASATRHDVPVRRGGWNEVVPAGEAIVSVPFQREEATPSALTSRDGGVTWQAEPLAGAQGPVKLFVGGANGAAVVVGTGDEYPAVDVWATDGEGWHHNRLEGDAVDPPTVLGRDEVAVVAFRARTSGMRMYVSRDGGRSWTEAATRAQPSAPHDPSRITRVETLFEGRWHLAARQDGRTWEAWPCQHEACLEIGAGDVRIRDGEVSVEGKDWEPIGFTDIQRPRQGDVSFDWLEQVGSGWLAGAHLYVPSDVSYGFLLHSTDGRRWRQIVDDTCTEAHITRPNSSYSPPAELDGRWFVSYNCADLSEVIESALLAVTPQGRPAVVEDTQLDDARLGEPRQWRDRIVVPVGSSAILAVRPEPRG